MLNGSSSSSVSNRLLTNAIASEGVLTMDWLPLSLSTTRHNGLFFTVLSDRGECTRGGRDAPGRSVLTPTYGLINPFVVPKVLVGDSVSVRSRATCFSRPRRHIGVQRRRRRRWR